MSSSSRNGSAPNTRSSVQSPCDILSSCALTSRSFRIEMCLAFTASLRASIASCFSRVASVRAVTASAFSLIASWRADSASFTSLRAAARASIASAFSILACLRASSASCFSFAAPGAPASPPAGPCSPRQQLPDEHPVPAADEHYGRVSSSEAIFPDKM